jgi:RimJ/RimL family protein N-acetyltransferase
MELETESLLINNFSKQDCLDLHKLSLDKEKSQYYYMDHAFPTDIASIKDICDWFSKTDEFLAIRIKNNNNFIGFVSLNNTDDKKIKNLGYCLHSDYHGKGFATQACRRILNHAFNNLDCEKISSGTGIENIPSVRLLEKLGFVMTLRSKTHFRSDSKGDPLTFDNGLFELTRDRWLLYDNL